MSLKSFLGEGAILNKNSYPESDFGKRLVWYTSHQALPESVQKPFVPFLGYFHQTTTLQDLIKYAVSKHYLGQ